jgi:alkylation response protein AidB-like acyl-CoA dehydrogenase
MSASRRVDSALAVSRAASTRRSAQVAPDCRGLNFFDIDESLNDLLAIYMDRDLLAHLRPHLQRLGELAGGSLNELSLTAEKHPPVLHMRDRFGRDEEWVDYHPSYQALEKVAYGDFGLHVLTHKSGVLGWPKPMPQLAKHVLHYLFTQAEFGLLCPVNLTDSSSVALDLYGSADLRKRYLASMRSQDMSELARGAQFLTEKGYGSDLGSVEMTAVRDGERWRLYGERWFCSSVDAEVNLLLARPEGAPEGYRGLGLFLMPKTLEDGTRNAYRIARLKDKLGTRTMASGELLIDGAVAYQLGELDQGLKQMLVMVNSSRLSHLNRAAGMMRRCLNEAIRATTHRSSFGEPVIAHPLMRRQIVKMMVPVEQALSAMMFAAMIADAKDDPRAAAAMRMLTPIAKYRACRDNITVATGAMEARGGNGYIEDWPNARLIRDAHVGLLWEGTSNINSIDAIRRGVAKEAAHLKLGDMLLERLQTATGLPGPFRTRLEDALARALRFAEQVAVSADNERFCRVAAASLYHASTAVLMAVEGVATAERRGDARRLLLARFVLDHRFDRKSHLDLTGLDWEERATSVLLDSLPFPMEDVAQLLDS